jgi:UDP-N-acetyl-D-mannosaminuronate dehydrogenase
MLERFKYNSGYVGGVRRKSVDIEPTQTADAGLIVTDHDAVDYEYIVEKAALIIDTRNAMKKTSGGAPIVKA